MLLVIVVVVAAFFLVVLPQLWIHRVMDRHAVEREDIPGTGAEFARHVLDQLKLNHVKVEQTEMGNHYDPISRTVRLEPRFMSGRSLSAVVVAAHEIGHAIQHAMGLPMFERRIKVAEKAHIFNMIAAGFLFAAPLLVLIGKTPMALVINVVGIVGSIVLSLMTQIATLPVEFDASFKRALPLLQKGRFVRDEDMPAARSLLRVAAYTYVAGLLRTLIQIPGLGRLPRL